jgi:hypothetical protein
MDMLVVTRKGDPVWVTAWGDAHITYAELQECTPIERGEIFELGTLGVLPKVIGSTTIDRLKIYIYGDMTRSTW